ncbi:hypothetical protein MD537_12015 [Flavihumibacter sediminis]|nr:hypothetical protein [Flavihumibacter sediminis]
MKQLLLFVFFSFTFTLANGQVPLTMNYQAVVRTADGNPVASKSIKVKIILNTKENGVETPFYSEVRAVTTNALGLFQVAIASPGYESVTGNIVPLITDNKPKTIRLEVDLDNSGAFINMGSQDVATVPYAFQSYTSFSAKYLIGAVQAFAIETTTPKAYTFNENVTITFTHDFMDDEDLADPATGEFTVKESGLYYLSFTGNATSTAAGQNSAALGFITAQYYVAPFTNPMSFMADDKKRIITYSRVVNLNAGDVVRVYMRRETGADPITIEDAVFNGYRIR